MVVEANMFSSREVEADRRLSEDMAASARSDVMLGQRDDTIDEVIAHFLHGPGRLLSNVEDAQLRAEILQYGLVRISGQRLVRPTFGDETVVPPYPLRERTFALSNKTLLLVDDGGVGYVRGGIRHLAGRRQNHSILGTLSTGHHREMNDSVYVPHSHIRDSFADAQQERMYQALSSFSRDFGNSYPPRDHLLPTMVIAETILVPGCRDVVRI